MDAPSVLLSITESNWYADLLRGTCRGNKAPILVVPYPIYPRPEGPLPIEHDVLLYVKNTPEFMGAFNAIRRGGWKNTAMVTYGHYRRDDMIDLARRSRACVYCSTDDRGPLAGAEIALAGCPLIGIPHGCPWASIPGLGVEIPNFSRQNIQQGLERAVQMNRTKVREAALAFWDPDRIVKIILDALEPIALGN